MKCNAPINPSKVGMSKDAKGLLPSQSSSMMIGITADQTSAFKSVQSIGGARFSPNNAKPFVEDSRENKLVIQRIENNRPRPRIVYKNTESSDDEDNEQF